MDIERLKAQQLLAKLSIPTLSDKDGPIKCAKAVKPKVIAICGASGAGKTTIIKSLADTLGCPYMVFDDYCDENTYPPDMKKWLLSGGNFDQFKTPGFVEALLELRAQSQHPYLLIEEPFGKERSEMALLIDHTILLAPGLELCLCRVIKRHVNRSPNDTASVLNYLDRYEDHYRDIYQFVVNRVENNCDLVLRQVDSTAQITEQIIDWLRRL